MFCRNCGCHESACYCDNNADLVEAHYCDNCGTIVAESDLDRNGVCWDCVDQGVDMEDSAYYPD